MSAEYVSDQGNGPVAEDDPATPASRLSVRRPVLPAWAARAAGAVDTDRLSEDVVSACSAVFGRLGRDEEFLLSLRASVSQNVSAVRQLLIGADEIGSAKRDRVHAFANVQARLSVPQTSLQRSYRVAFFRMWSRWVDGLQEAVKSLGIDRDQALRAMQDLSLLIFAYQDQVASEVAEIYARDYDTLSQSRAHLRQRIVRDLLAGSDQVLPAADAAIVGYPLSAHHLAVIVSVDERGAAVLPEAVRRALPGSDVLMQQLTMQTVVMWVGRARPWSDVHERVLGELLNDRLLVASSGRAHTGVVGFRASYLDAAAVESIRGGWRHGPAPRLLRHADVALEILLLRDPGAAADFIHAELGQLSEPTANAERLRQTLGLSLELGSHVATAECLGVHEHTVRNRLRQVEKILGQPWQNRRTELQVGLRLLRLMGAGKERDRGH